MPFFNIKKKVKEKLSKDRSKNAAEQKSTAQSPSSENVGKKAKKENYKKRMMKKYGITDQQYEQEKKQAQEQLKNWENHKKEQAIKIFESKSSYISKTTKSDLKHPSVGRSKKVLNAAGQMVDVEFGKTKEHYLFSLAPNKQFVEIRTQTAHEQALNPLREKQRKKFSKIDKSKQTDKTKLLAEYDNVKNVDEDEPEECDATGDGNTNIDEAEELNTEIQLTTNCTDEKHELFTPAWYRLSISRSQIAKGKMTYWMAANEEDAAYDDDPEGKWTVTAEKVCEAIEMLGGRVKDSGVVEPKDPSAAMNENLGVLWDRYKKTSTREICYTNTLKGTIDFAVKGKALQAAIKSEPATEPALELKFPETVTTYVFKGNRIRRQGDNTKEKHKVMIFEEPLVEIKREDRDEQAG